MFIVNMRERVHLKGQANKLLSFRFEWFFFRYVYLFQFIYYCCVSVGFDLCAIFGWKWNKRPKGHNNSKNARIFLRHTLGLTAFFKKYLLLLLFVAFYTPHNFSLIWHNVVGPPARLTQSVNIQRIHLIIIFRCVYIRLTHLFDTRHLFCHSICRYVFLCCFQIFVCDCFCLAFGVLLFHANYVPVTMLQTKHLNK